MEALIINADDLGLNASVNKAIMESFDRELINSATIMANMPGFEEAVDLVQDAGISSKIGVHLVLTEGNPLTEGIKKIPYLFKWDGKDYATYPSTKQLFSIGKAEKKLIFDELAAQIRKVKASCIFIYLIDNHHHLHEVWQILEVVVALAREFQIPKVRILNNLAPSRYPHKNFYRAVLNRYIKMKKLHHSDYFGSRLDYLAAAGKKPNRIENRKIEVMVHPDYGEKGALVDKLFHLEYELDFRREINGGIER